MSSSFVRIHFFLTVLALLTVVRAESVSAEEEQEKEKGAWVERPDGRHLNLLIDGSNFELHFYDEEKEPVEPDVSQAMLHYTSRILRARESLLLTPVQKEEKTILASPRNIRPPYQFEILLVLNLDSAGKETETRHIIFQQEAEDWEDPNPPPPEIGR